MEYGETIADVRRTKRNKLVYTCKICKVRLNSVYNLKQHYKAKHRS